MENELNELNNLVTNYDTVIMYFEKFEQSILFFKDDFFCSRKVSPILLPEIIGCTAKNTPSMLIILISHLLFI